MNKIIIALRRKYENQVVRESWSRPRSIVLILTVVLLLGGLVSCTPGNTSRWRMDGHSMEPNLTDGQFVEAEPVEELSTLQRGDIVIFEWNRAPLLKRLIGLPGETIEIRQGSIIIDGEVYDEPYEVIAPEYAQEPIKLGEDEYYVLGDNRNDSRDSHNFGPITGEMIKERVNPPTVPASPTPTVMSLSYNTEHKGMIKNDQDLSAVWKRNPTSR